MVNVFEEIDTRRDRGFPKVQQKTLEPERPGKGFFGSILESSRKIKVSPKTSKKIKKTLLSTGPKKRLRVPISGRGPLREQPIGVLASRSRIRDLFRRGRNPYEVK